MQLVSYASISGTTHLPVRFHAGHDHGPVGMPMGAPPMGAAPAATPTMTGMMQPMGAAPGGSMDILGAGPLLGYADAGHAHGGGYGGGHDHHHIEPQPPAYGDPRFLQGSVGPFVGDGEADTLVIPDGDGYFGLSGRQQNDGDKEQNNYSVTDANYSNTLGLLAADPDTGETLTYNQHTQMYNAAGYLAVYAPEVYAGLVANQDAGRGTVLGAAAYIMGLVQTADPAVDGVDISQVPMTIPGTNVDARHLIHDPKDATNQDWARMHHAQASWEIFQGLTEAGLDFKTAVILSGDDAVSGAGRLNGVNNQNGTTGFNADESAVYRLGAKVEQRTGIPVIQLMMAGHQHNGQDESSFTNPRINSIIGLPENDRSASPERAAALRDALLSGDALEGGLEALRQSNKFAMRNGRFLDDATRNAASIIDIVRAEDEAIAATLPPPENNNNDNNNDNNEPVGLENATGPGTGEITGAGAGVNDLGLEESILAGIEEIFPAVGIPGALPQPVNLDRGLDADGRIIPGGPLDFTAGITEDDVRDDFRGSMETIIAALITTAVRNPWLEEDGDEDAFDLMERLVVNSGGRLESIIRAAMGDGVISAAEADAIRGAARASVADLIEEALADGEITEDEFAAIIEASRAADSEALDQARNRGPSELDRLVEEAMADGEISEEERAAIFAAADDAQRAVLEDVLADGKLSVEDRDRLLQAADDARRATDMIDPEGAAEQVEGADAGEDAAADGTDADGDGESTGDADAGEADAAGEDAGGDEAAADEGGDEAAADEAAADEAAADEGGEAAADEGGEAAADEGGEASEE